MKQKLKTTRTFERLADELEAILAAGGPDWKLFDKFSQFCDAEDRYEGSESIKPYVDRARAALDKFVDQDDSV